MTKKKNCSSKIVHIIIYLYIIFKNNFQNIIKIIDFLKKFISVLQVMSCEHSFVRVSIFFLKN